MDLSAYKSLKINGVELVKLVINGVVAWAKKTYTNLVPLSTDTDGSIYNGVGYKENVRLSSSGGVSGSSQNGSVTTGFIPWGGDKDIIRIKGVTWLNTSGHHYINFYDANKNFLDYTSWAVVSGGNIDHIIAVSAANGVTTFDFNENYGTSNLFLQNVRKAKYFRMTAYGKGANFVLTINEEI